MEEKLDLKMEGGTQHIIYLLTFLKGLLCASYISSNDFVNVSTCGILSPSEVNPVIIFTFQRGLECCRKDKHLACGPSVGLAPGPMLCATTSDLPQSETSSNFLRHSNSLSLITHAMTFPYNSFSLMLAGSTNWYCRMLIRASYCFPFVWVW